MDFFIRLTSLIKKELLAVLRDKKSRLALIIPPVLQICIFGYAATMNVTRVPYAVLDKDGGELAAQYIADLEGTGIFRRQATAATEKDIDSLIDSRDIVLGLTIPPDFSQSANGAARLAPAHWRRPKHEHRGHRPQLRPANRLQLRGGTPRQKRSRPPG